jgi:DNA-binding beta-propeller fold protein YncE
MQYFPEGPEQQVRRSWPAPDQVPRLEYAGQLIGEQNFILEQGSESRGEKFLRWLVGLGGSRDNINQLLRPQSGIVDANGRILVTDAGRPAVFVFDEANATLAVWREAAPGVDFQSPVGIAARGTGEYLVADAKLGEVFVLSQDGVPVGRFGGNVLVRPTGLDIDAASGRVYVADKGAHLIKVFSGDGDLLQTIGVPGDAPGELNAPMHIRVAGSKIYVSDALNAYVQIFSLTDGQPLGRIGQRGLYVGNLVRPKGVTVDSDGNIYVVESYYDHLLIYDEDGQFLMPIGGTGSGAGQFFLPAGMWSDKTDRIFVADMFNGRVVIFRYVGSGE